MELNELSVGTRVLVQDRDEQVLGEITEMATAEGKIKTFGILEYDLRVKLNLGTNLMCDVDKVIQIVEPSQRVYCASQLYKAGHRTSTGSGKTRHILADNLPIAIGKCLDWIRENHPDIDADEINPKDEPNYRFSDGRTTLDVILDSDETISQGWPDSWIDVRLTIEDQDEILNR